MAWATAAAPVQQVVNLPTQGGQSWFFYIMLNPLVVLWVLFLAWILAQVVEDGIISYIATPLTRFGTDAASLGIKLYEDARLER